MIQNFEVKYALDIIVSICQVKNRRDETMRHLSGSPTSVSSMDPQQNKASTIQLATCETKQKGSVIPCVTHQQIKTPHQLTRSTDSGVSPLSLNQNHLAVFGGRPAHWLSILELLLPSLNQFGGTAHVLDLVAFSFRHSPVRECVAWASKAIIPWQRSPSLRRSNPVRAADSIQILHVPQCTVVSAGATQHPCVHEHK